MGDKDNEYLKDVADQLKGMDESARKEAAEMAKKAEEMDKQLSGYRDNKKSILALISVVAVCFALFHFYTGGFGMFTAIRQRAIHLAFALWICMMRYSSNKNAGPKVEPWLPHFFLWIMIMGTINIPLIDYARKAKVNMTIPVLVIGVVCIICAVLKSVQCGSNGFSLLQQQSVVSIWLSILIRFSREQVLFIQSTRSWLSTSW